jgi:hypothetical protein
MEEMSFKNSNLKNINLNIKKREIIINKFIEKFPKTKLHTLIQVNRHCNKKNIELDENFNNVILSNLINNNFEIKN